MPLAEAERQRFSLTSEQVQALVRLGRRCQDLFGHPVDIEWGLDSEGKILLLQARPITSLCPLLDSNRGGLRLYLNVNVTSQQMCEPFTPMGEEFFRLLLMGTLERMGYRFSQESPWWFKSVGGQLYVDVTELVTTERGLEKVSAAIEHKSPNSASTLRYAWGLYREELQGPPFRPTWPLIKTGLGMAWTAMLGALSPSWGRERARKLGEDLLEQLHRSKTQVRGLDETLNFFEKAVTESVVVLWEQVVGCAVPFEWADKVERNLKTWFGETLELETVRRGLTGNPTTDMNRELLRIARDLEASELTISPELPQVQRFLEAYGHRSTVDVDLGMPRWSEEPGYVLELLRSYRESGDSDRHLQKLEEERHLGDRAVETVAQRVTKDVSTFQGWKARRMLQGYRTVAGVRELPKFHLTQILALLREVLIRLGGNLVRGGRLDREEQIFFLRLADLRKSGALSDLAEENRQAYGRALARKAVPLVLVNNGHTIYSAPAVRSGSALIGLAVSPGIAEGPARVIEDPRVERLRPGEILIARGTNPAWTPLFMHAAAVVTETGGPISHGSIVAREYGLPAVVGVDRVTEQITTGQLVRVDGHQGTVEVLEATEDIPT